MSPLNVLPGTVSLRVHLVVLFSKNNFLTHVHVNKTQSVTVPADLVFQTEACASSSATSINESHLHRLADRLIHASLICFQANQTRLMVNEQQDIVHQGLVEKRTEQQPLGDVDKLEEVWRGIEEREAWGDEIGSGEKCWQNVNIKKCHDRD